jgi:hypothetical protein
VRRGADAVRYGLQGLIIIIIILFMIIIIIIIILFMIIIIIIIIIIILLAAMTSNPNSTAQCMKFCKPYVAICRGHAIAGPYLPGAVQQGSHIQLYCAGYARVGPEDELKTVLPIQQLSQSGVWLQAMLRPPIPVSAVCGPSINNLSVLRQMIGRKAALRR